MNTHKFTWERSYGERSSSEEKKEFESPELGLTDQETDVEPEIDCFEPEIEEYMKARCPELYLVLKQLLAQRAPKPLSEVLSRIFLLLGEKPWLNDEEKFIDEFCPRLARLLKQMKDQKKIPMELINIIFEFLKDPWSPPVLTENGEQYDY